MGGPDYTRQKQSPNARTYYSIFVFVENATVRTRLKNLINEHRLKIYITISLRKSKYRLVIEGLSFVKRIRTRLKKKTYYY